MLGLKITKAELQANFQDRRHLGNGSAYYKMSNYYPILTQIGTQTKKNMLSLKVTITEVTIKFQDGRRRHVGNSSECYKVGKYHSILMKIGIQTKKSMPSSEITKKRRRSSFKMDAAAILESEVNAVKRAITMLIECKSHKSGSLQPKNSKN
jgi:hypothetical protein